MKLAGDTIGSLKRYVHGIVSETRDFDTLSISKEIRSNSSFFSLNHKIKGKHFENETVSVTIQWQHAGARKGMEWPQGVGSHKDEASCGVSAVDKNDGSFSFLRNVSGYVCELAGSRKWDAMCSLGFSKCLPGCGPHKERWAPRGSPVCPACL